MSGNKPGAGSKTRMARLYVKQCLNDTPGAQLLLECTDKNDQEVMRVICSTERKRLEDILDYDLSAKVRISKSEIEGKFYIKLLRRDSTVLENFIRIAPDGTVTKEILMPEVDTAVLNDLRSKVLDGLTPEMAESRDANGIYSYFRSWRPSHVTVALMYLKKELKQSYEDVDTTLDEFADRSFDALNQERLAISLKRKEDGEDDYK